jgi:hypothetical protein
MNSNRVGTYHRTSIDAAKENYTTIARAGQKRTIEEFHLKHKMQNRQPSLISRIEAAFIVQLFRTALSSV